VEIDARRQVVAGVRRAAFAVMPRPPEPIRRLVRGDTRKPAEVVSAGGVAAVGGVVADFGLRADAPEGLRRARLAVWIADPKNPLFARVIVNRIWRGHFGAGLVETPSDFGFNGERPTHPELLDWLAAELPRRGWSLKAMHRLIVMSAGYRQSSRPDPSAVSIDASGRLLWRKPPLRLDAEMVRDAMLAVAGVLDPSLGGPSFRDFDVTQAPGTPAHLYVPIAADGPGTNRRTLYRAWARGGRNGFLDAFDCPDPSTTAPRRAVTTTPLQALAMLNNEMVLRLADRFADRLRREAGANPDRQLERAYRLALGRSPDEDERARARAVAEQFGPEALARALFNCNEFLYVE
jgi:hypothetical protein